jgi:predicted RecA/RadA family phage recombinase
MRNFIEHGEVWEIPAAAAVVSGDFILQGSAFGIATHSAAQDELVRVRPGGVVTLAAATGQAWTLGAKLYWDATGKTLTTTATSNTLVGFAWAVKGTADAVGLVKLNTNV